MLEIICDQYELYSIASADILVTDSAQFEETLVKIQRYTATGEPLQIIVRNPALFDWFDAATKYGAKKRIIDPVAKLASNIQQPVVPEYLQKNPRWIVELKLLEKSKEQPVQHESVDQWLKRVLLGEIWQEKAPDSVEDLSALFDFLLRRKRSSLHPLERYLLYEQLQQWSMRNPDTSELFNWLKKDPFKRARCIVWEQLLSLFPDEKTALWLQQDNIWYDLCQFPHRHRLPRLSLSVQLPENIVSFVRSFLAKEWDSSPKNTLSFISGTLDFENSFLLERLRQQLHSETSISQSMYDKLLQLKRYPEVIALARLLIPAEKPSPLAENYSPKDMQNWIGNEYLPFYHSCSLLGQIETTEPYITDFEKWLNRHYTEMLFGDVMAYRQIARLKEQLVSGDSVLLVVFDGLDYICACEELLPVLQENDLFPVHDPVPFFAFLPTQTHIAKPTLVSGKMKSQIPDEVPTAFFYKKLLQECLSVTDGDIRSKTDREATFLELIQEPAMVYLYLDNYLDRELLHANIRQYHRKKKYGEYVKKQAAGIIQCLKDYKDMYGKSLQVVISSDHGYTVIPKHSTTIDIDDAGKTGKNRTVSGSIIKNTAPLIEKQIWRLNPDLYGLNQEMVIPRGYACFKSRPHGATHGGCTPQEMAVPWFVLTQDKPMPVKALSITFEGEIFRKRADNTLTLNISNPNSYSITIVELELEGLELTSNLPVKIKKNAIGTLHSSFNASSTNESNVEFSVLYRLKSVAGELEINLTINVPTTGAMSTEFDDDFEI